MVVDARAIPRTDATLDDPLLADARQRLRPALVRAAVRDAQAAARDGRITVDEIPAFAATLLTSHGVRRVLNATGVILHTNLGRAALAPAAIEAVVAAAGPSTVEFDLATGARGRRGADVVASLRAALPGAGDVMVVNNGAAALLLAVTVLAQGREVLVSRGELVEIGDGFRLPDLMVSTGARIREVGTTNRTRLEDYRAAVGPEVAAVVKIHPSNFTVAGFTSSVGVNALAGLGLPVVADVGSGLLDPDPLLPDEPSVSDALAAGAALVTCSGDKLLGGPQAGILAGDATLVERCRRHPMARALRVDKLTLAALDATLRVRETPTFAALHVDLAALRERTTALAAAVGGDVVDTVASVGGGGAPGVELPSCAVALPERAAAALRSGPAPVIGRVHGGRCLLDLRTIPPEQDDSLAALVAAALA